MARIIPQAQPDPFAPQVAGLYGTRDRPYQGFQTANRFLDTAKAVADSPLTGLALRGIQAGAGGISDMLADAAARRMEGYKAEGLEGELSPDLAAPEPYKPMAGLSLRGDQPEGLGLSLRDMPEQEPAQGWSSESRLGELQGVRGEDLARAAQRKLGVAPDARQSVLSKGILPAFTSPRVPGLEMDPNAARLEALRPQAAAPSAPMLPQPRVPRIAESEPLPTAEQLGERRRSPPLTLDFEAEAETPPPRPPIATQTEGDVDVEQKMRDEAWRKFIEGDDAEPTDTGPTLKEDLRLKAPGLRDLPQPDVNLEDIEVPSAGLEGLAEAAPVLGRSGRLAAATDEQLNSIRDSLRGDDPETLRRIAQIDRELQQRSDVTRVANRAITPEELIKRARLATTPEAQAQVLADSARARLPITSVADLIGDQREKAFRQELMGTFPATARKTPEQIAADIALLDAKAQERREAAALAEARAKGEAIRAPAQADKYSAEGARALAQGLSEESLRNLRGSQAGLADEKALTDKALRDPRVRNLDAKTKNLDAATDKLRKEMARVKAKAASGGYRNNNKEAKADLETLKALEQIQNKSMSEVDVEAKAAIAAASDAEKAAATARLRLMSIEPPGDPPREPSLREDPKIQAELAREKSNWARRGAAYESARKMLEDEEANVISARKVRDAAIVARKIAADERKMYDPTIRAVAAKIASRYGAGTPTTAAPTSTTPKAAPTTSPASSATVEGKIYMVGGKRYVGKNGALEAVP